MTREEVIAEARSWVGTPFVPQQSVKGHGCDCAGLIRGVGRAFGIESDVGPYKQQPKGFELSRICREYMTEIPLSDMQAGDVVEIAFTAEPQHLGILVPYRSGLGIVHALMLSKKVVEHRLDSTWRNRITAAYVLPGVE